MKRTLLSNVSLYTRCLLHPPSTHWPYPSSSIAPLATSTRSRLRFFSCGNDSSNENPNACTETSVATPVKKDVLAGVQDVTNKDLKMQIEKYFAGDEEALPTVFESILRRKLVEKHEETDEELLDELQMQPIDDVNDREFESDFEELHETDDEIDDLYNARDTVMKRMAKDEYFNMDEKKWDELVEDGIKHGALTDTKECEEILEDMLSWDKLLPGKTLFFN